jgi:phosphoribosylformylglycinamidine cyclo-ligase
VAPDELITGEGITAGMVVHAWPSTGLHTNGYSLARRALLEGDEPLALREDPGSLGMDLASALLAVHRSYLRPVQQLRAVHPIVALCHITGGGLIDNLPRVLPDGLAVEIDAGAWAVPPLFGLLQERGQVDLEEMRRVFNLGLGMVAILPEPDAGVLESVPDAPIRVGRVTPRGDGPPVCFVGSHRGLS